MLSIAGEAKQLRVTTLRASTPLRARPTVVLHPTVELMQPQEGSAAHDATVSDSERSATSVEPPVSL
eukprot:4201738-Prymnesium_polylepis.1